MTAIALVVLTLILLNSVIFTLRTIRYARSSQYELDQRLKAVSH
jgi:Tfp pilus assembly protein PilV